MKKFTYILIGLVIVLAFMLFKSCEKQNEQAGLIETISATLDTTRNELGQQSASISVISTEREKDFLKIKTQDSTIQWLQSVVKDYKGRLKQAVVLSNTTESNGSTETIVRIDTVDNVIYETYCTEWENRWEKGWIEAGRDSIHRKIQFKNEYELTIGNRSNGWFKKKTFDVSILNLNPNTYTTELRAYSVKENPKRFTLGLQSGYGLNLLTGKPVFYMGAGVQFTILGIK